MFLQYVEMKLWTSADFCVLKNTHAFILKYPFLQQAHSFQLQLYCVKKNNGTKTQSGIKMTIVLCWECSKEKGIITIEMISNNKTAPFSKSRFLETYGFLCLRLDVDINISVVSYLFEDPIHLYYCIYQRKFRFRIIF